jgi:hypothetical protein
VNLLPIIEMRLEGFDNAAAGSEERKELMNMLMRTLDIYGKRR